MRYARLLAPVQRANPGYGALVDWTHPIIQALQPKLLVIIQPGNLRQQFDPVFGQLSVVTAGNPTNTVKPFLGTVINFTDNSTQQYSGHDTAVDRDITLAMLINDDSSTLVSKRYMGTSLTTNAGFTLQGNGGTPELLTLVKGGVVAIAGANVSIDAANPKFLAASYQKATGTINYAGVRLDTGATQTGSPAANTQATLTGDGTWQFGGDTSGVVNQFRGSVSLFAIGYGYMTTDQLVQWGRNPWQVFIPSGMKGFLPAAVVAANPMRIVMASYQTY